MINWICIEGKWHFEVYKFAHMWSVVYTKECHNLPITERSMIKKLSMGKTLKLFESIKNARECSFNLLIRHAFTC